MSKQYWLLEIDRNLKSSSVGFVSVKFLKKYFFYCTVSVLFLNLIVYYLKKIRQALICRSKNVLVDGDFDHKTFADEGEANIRQRSTIWERSVLNLTEF